MSTCRGVQGVIFDGRAMLYLEPAEGSDSKGLHYLYHHKDLIMDRSASVQHDPEINQSDEKDYISGARAFQRHEQGYSGRNRTRHKRATASIKLREPFHPDPTPRYLELALVADKRQFEASRRDVRAVQATMIELANIVNSMFSPLNIYITLVAVVVWSEGDKIRVTKDADSTMRRFLSLDSVTTTPYDNAFLITHLRFDHGVVGRAHISQLCRSKFYHGLAGGVVVNHSERIGLVASTLAHELGHNFGMKHDADCIINYCPDEHCIMVSHTTDTIQSYWSECSLKALKVSFKNELDYCLHNKPKRFLNRLGPKCGNGMTETGEQCDCGTTVYGGVSPCHACCDPDTCMLRQNATCAAGTCCDLKTCRPKSAGVVCRSAQGECDLPEYCSGDFEHCPRNVYKMDSTPCRVGKDQSYCMRGTCRSRHSQCQFVWGAKASSHEECYAVKNPSGNLYGNCGYDHSTSTYTPCQKEDAPCGLLQCHTDNRDYKIVLGIAQYYDIRTPLSSYQRKDSKTQYYCTTAAFNFYPDIADLGRVPDGATCGNGKMCLNQRCVPLKSVRERISRYASSVCPSDCSGHGICNSEGHCHCDNGYAPPLCASKGQGGSKDSGPASAKPEREILKILMYVLFLGIISSIILLLVLLYYSRNGVLWEQMKNAYYLCCAKCSCNKMTESRKFVENVSEINKDTDLITDNDYKVTNSKPTLETEIKMPSVESESKEPMLNLVDGKIRIENNDRESYSAEISCKNTSQHAIDSVKLKSVKPAAKNNTHHNHTQNMIKNVKLRPIVQKLLQNQETKDCNDDDEIRKMAMDLKKPKSLSSKTVNTHLNSVSNKDEGIFYIRPKDKNKNNGNTTAEPRTDLKAKSEFPPQKPILKPLLPVSHINKEFPKNMTKNPNVKTLIKNDNIEVRDKAPVKSLVSLFEPEIKSMTPGFHPETSINNVKPAILKNPVTKAIKPFEGGGK